MVDWIWRYPLKSAQGESLPGVFIGPDGPEGDRAWACVTADGVVVSAKNPRRWGRMLFAAGDGDGDGDVTVLVPGHEPVTASALAGLAAAGAPANIRRLRPNLVLSLDGEPAPGDVIRVGPEVTLRGLVPTPRCAVPAAAQPGLGPAPEVLHAIGRRRVEIAGLGRAACFGSYAQVLSAGTVAVGMRAVLAT